MSKAILVIDMPNNCEECALRKHETDAIPEDYCMTRDKEIINLNTKPQWCPLRFVPSKQYHSAYGSGRIEMSDDKIWNRCIDTILGR